MHRFHRCLPLVLALAACTGGGVGREQQGEGASADVTQVVTQAEALARFQSPIEPVKALAGGQPSLEALAREVARALAASDSAALQRAWVSRAEWAYLYFPTSPYMRPPYEMPPDVQWQLSLASSEKGLVRLLRRLGGARLEVRAVACDPAPVSEGGNRLWRGCRVSLTRGDGAPESLMLFRSALERDGRFKVLTYGGDL